MYTLVIIVFIAGYLGIALEHSIRINKTAIAIVTGIICWVLFMFASPSDTLLQSEDYIRFSDIVRLESGKQTTPDATELYREFVSFSLSEHLSEIAEILFFLMGAMTIVELVDAHHGFRLITDRIKTKNTRSLLWVICVITFLLSSVLDNLTTTIVMVSLARKIIPERSLRLLFVGMIVIAANAGGAWTPIGDVTTTMLWIGGQITTLNIMKGLLLPSIVCMAVPLMILSFTIKKESTVSADSGKTSSKEKSGSARLMLLSGVGALISVPVFKTFTHLPPLLRNAPGIGYSLDTVGINQPRN